MKAAGGFEIETVLDIEHGPDVVFAFLADTRSFRALDPALVEFEPEGRVATGLTGRFVHRRGGLIARTTWRVESAEAPSHLEVDIRGLGYGMVEIADLEATPTGTRARFVDRVWPTSLAGRVLVALSGEIMRRDLRARAGRLKAILEGQTPGGLPD
jgi:hypothetical protein